MARTRKHTATVPAFTPTVHGWTPEDWRELHPPDGPTPERQARVRRIERAAQLREQAKRLDLWSAVVDLDGELSPCVVLPVDDGGPPVRLTAAAMDFMELRRPAPTGRASADLYNALTRLRYSGSAVAEAMSVFAADALESDDVAEA